MIAIMAGGMLEPLAFSGTSKKNYQNMAVSHNTSLTFL